MPCARRLFADFADRAIIEQEALKVIKSGADTIFTATDRSGRCTYARKEPRRPWFQGDAHHVCRHRRYEYLAQFGASAEGTFAPGIAPSDFAPDFAKLTAYQAKYNTAPDYTGALGYDFVREMDGALATNDWSANNIAAAAIAYHYADPAISNFQFLPDRTVNYAMELSRRRRRTDITRKLRGIKLKIYFEIMTKTARIFWWAALVVIVVGLAAWGFLETADRMV